MVDDVLSEARAAVAGGGDPDWKQLRDRIRAAAPDEPSRAAALARLERIAAVHRARRLPAAAPAAQPAPPPRPRALLRTRPTITGNIEVRRAEPFLLRWGEERAVAAWELRLSERPDPRGDYEVRESRELPGEATSVELPLGELPLRIHLLGRDRTGRLVRRAIVSGLTRETWNERWQRRASAS